MGEMGRVRETIKKHLVASLQAHHRGQVVALRLVDGDGGARRERLGDVETEVGRGDDWKDEEERQVQQSTEVPRHGGSYRRQEQTVEMRQSKKENKVRNSC